jgi:tetratricopeptide (TPR) repeat protein
MRLLRKSFYIMARDFKIGRLKPLRFRYIALILLIAIGGCGGKPPIPGIEERANTLPALPARDSVNPRAFMYFSNGSIFEAMRNFAMANRQYEEALKFYPGSPEIRYSYASSFFQMNDYPRALYEAQKISPRNLRAWLLIGDCYRALGQNDSAMAAYGQTLKIDSENVNVYRYMAAYYEQSGKLDSAVWAYETIARLSPNYQTYQDIGNLYMRARQLDPARKYYSMSLAFDSSEINLRSFLGLAAIFEAIGDKAEARRYLEKARQLSPQNTYVLNKLIDIYEDEKSLTLAIAAAESLNRIAPGDTNGVRRLGALYFEADSLDKADSIFNSLLSAGDEHMVTYYFSGRISFLKKNFGVARDRFQKMTIVADSVTDGWINLGLTYQFLDSGDIEIKTYKDGLNRMRNLDDSLRIMFALGSAMERNDQFDSSVSAFEKIISFAPDHAPSLNYLGYMLADRGIRLEYALGLIKKALEISPDNGAYVDSYGWVLYRLGNYQDALQELLRAYKLVGDDPVILEHVGDAYEAVGDTANARVFWEKARESGSAAPSLLEKLEK